MKSKNDLAKKIGYSFGYTIVILVLIAVVIILVAGIKYLYEFLF